MRNPNQVITMRQEQIAVFRALYLGDLLCAVPAFRAIRRARPEAHIALIGLPWARDFVERMPYLDEFIEFPGFPGLPERRPNAARLQAFLNVVRSRRFDLAIQMHGSGRLSNALVGLLGAHQVAGFYVPGLPGRPIPDPAWFLPWPDRMPEIRRLQALTSHLGMAPCGDALELPILPAEQRAFAELRSRLAVAPQGFVCIHPGARLTSRRWLPERFARVADRLAGAGLTVVLTGTAEETALLDEIGDAMRYPAIDLGGRTSLGTLAALVAKAQLVVCNDTGMSHVAAAVGTPSVVISLGGDPQRWQPLDTDRHRVLWHPVPCRPCSWDRCPIGHQCATGIGVEAVVAASFILLSSSWERRHDAE